MSRCDTSLTGVHQPTMSSVADTPVSRGRSPRHVPAPICTGQAAAQAPCPLGSERLATSRAWLSPARQLGNASGGGRRVGGGHHRATISAESLLVEELDGSLSDHTPPPVAVRDARSADSGTSSELSWHDVFAGSDGQVLGGTVSDAAAGASSESDDDGALPEPSRHAAQQRFTVSLLAQLCAQQKASPQVFIDQCLELYKAGLLDSVDFLTDILNRATAAPTTTAPQRAVAGGVLTPYAITNTEHARASLRPMAGRRARRIPPHVTRALRAAGIQSSRPLPRGYMASMYAAGQSMMRHSLAMASNAHALSPTASSRYLTEFEVLREIGKGGFGRVFHVRHRMDHAEYAVRACPSAWRAPEDTLTPLSLHA